MKNQKANKFEFELTKANMNGFMRRESAFEWLRRGLAIVPVTDDINQ